LFPAEGLLFHCKGKLLFPDENMFPRAGLLFPAAGLLIP